MFPAGLASHLSGGAVSALTVKVTLNILENEQSLSNYAALGLPFNIPAITKKCALEMCGLL